MEKWVALGLAAVFGIGYAGITRWVRWRSRDHGLTPFLVTGGVAGVVGCYLLVVDVEAVAWLVGLFVVGGLPMIAEYYDHRWREEQASADRVEIEM